jgi:uncharacterized protein YdeI (YjbR/CyaY-like superfamily)
MLFTKMRKTVLQMKFENRQSFREWLVENALSDDGLWLVFDKRKPANGLIAAEALEEALCFGWIDGQIQSIDGNTYRKYFKQRKTEVLTEEQAAEFANMLNPFETAYANFMKMPKSAKRAYASSYFFGAKTDEGKQKRFTTIVERLNLDLNPMESMKKKLTAIPQED